MFLKTLKMTRVLSMSVMNPRSPRSTRDVMSTSRMTSGPRTDCRRGSLADAPPRSSRPASAAPRPVGRTLASPGTLSSKVTEDAGSGYPQDSDLFFQTCQSYYIVLDFHETCLRNNRYNTIKRRVTKSWYSMNKKDYPSWYTLAYTMMVFADIKCTILCTNHLFAFKNTQLSVYMQCQCTVQCHDVLGTGSWSPGQPWSR